MNRFTPARWILVILTALGLSVRGENFVNFETAPMHPLALSPDGKTLAVCNLPDARVELFDVTQAKPRALGAIFTGVDPVTARFTPGGELWVVNYISDSISVIDTARMAVVATLPCFDGPADVVFTKAGQAFVSHAGANVVKVWDIATRQSVAVINIDGDRPKAMAMSPDESEIYVAILESGNSSTIIAPQLTGLSRNPQPSVADLPEAPNSGLNPGPNVGQVFSPVINPKIPATNLPPRVGVIVRKRDGRWMDDNHGDWTEYISGTNAFLTGRQPGWDVADHDVAVINTTNRSVRYIRGLMNICFDVAVNPASGKIAVIGTDAINETRFESVLKSIFARMKLALVDPNTSAATIKDLNPHLDYIKTTLPMAQRKQSVGDPRGIAWNSRGTRAYVTGMGSNNILMLDENGDRVGPAVELPEGPTGVLVDDAGGRVFALARFAAALVTLDATNLTILSTNQLFDPTPTKIKVGRKHFYDTVANSGLGQVSCATCHVDGRFDRLAWDLGDPAGDLVAINSSSRNFFLAAFPTNTFHPMKGPMVTQTLQDIIGHEPFHWRGDRDGIEAFNVTFTNLQGADSELSDAEMQEFEDFLETITFPPNPFRFADNSMRPFIDVAPERALGRGKLKAGDPLPAGSPQRGMAAFRVSTGATACGACHTLPSGLGPDAIQKNGVWTRIATGPKGEHHLGMVSLQRSGGLPFKAQQLRNLFEKIGFDLRGPVSRSGFGFFHDGRVDSLTRFLQDGFGLTDDQETADLIAFLLALTGSDLPPTLNELSPPAVPSKDVSAGVGVQQTVTNNFVSSTVQFMMSHARTATSRVDLVVHGMRDGTPHVWLMNDENFVSDKFGETNSLAETLAFASAATPLRFTFVPKGSGARIALDRDGDGFPNRTEIENGADPADANNIPDLTPRLELIELVLGQIHLRWFGAVGTAYKVQSRRDFAAGSDWSDTGVEGTIVTNPVELFFTAVQANFARFFRIVLTP
jgi:YVTN family beta-propeller protein